MEPLKPWYLSRTIWASVVVVAAAMAGAMGVAVEDPDAEALTDAILQAVTAVAGLAAIFGRLAARRRIG